MISTDVEKVSEWCVATPVPNTGHALSSYGTCGWIAYDRPTTRGGVPASPGPSGCFDRCSCTISSSGASAAVRS